MIVPQGYKNGRLGWARAHPKRIKITGFANAKAKALAYLKRWAI